ncbi:MAG: 16S rRNA (cytidine(1402)-2'-O)-methyltransferase [Candidatus Marinimicrobia bacterium]|nr:16S rRNA (cytidine(1402)-2'-O)-methyltransferase [Candidatus Neomarinimicrobiota bacterium]
MTIDPLPTGLYLVGTPIGNLGDITARALDTLRRAHLILAEDTRRSRQLLTHFEIRTPLLSCHRFNEAARVSRVLTALDAGQAVAYVTDAGMPAIADPGARLVQAVRAAGRLVTAAPGPSAADMALALSGWGGGAFHFEGFLPVKSGARARRLEVLLAMPHPVILYESPYRLLRLLEELETLAPERPLFLARELTKFFEETRLGPAAELRAAFAQRTVKGELVLLIAPQTEAK